MNAVYEPPCSIESEQAVLGGLMLNNAAWDHVAALLTAEDFHRREHRLIFRAVAELAQAGQPFDVLTVTDRLERCGHDETVGGLAYVGQLANDTPSAANTPTYAKSVADAAARRRWISVVSEIRDWALDPGSRELGEMQADALAKIGALRNVGTCARGNELELLRGNDLIPEPIAWLWQGWLAAGKLHVLGGAPGTGKTTLALALAAAVTSGGRFPDGAIAPMGNVVIWSGEDDPKDTLLPRLILSGADVSRTHFVGDVFHQEGRRSFDPAKDTDALRTKLGEIGDVKLLIVDPIVSAIVGDSHKNAEVRRGLQPLVDLAASLRCALLGITHFSKGTGGRDPVERLNGSLAFGALARVVLVAAKHQREDETGQVSRLFCRAKSNIGPDGGGFEYGLHPAELEAHPGVFASCVLWGEPMQGTARELLSVADATDEGDAQGPDEWLRSLLEEEGGSLDRKAVMQAARNDGFAERTVERARKRLKLTTRATGFGKDRSSVWSFPITAAESSSPPFLPRSESGSYGSYGSGGNYGDVREVAI